jgi:nucleoside-diphosphate kinase
MTRGPIVAAVLEKEDAVEEFRLLIGSTDPTTATDGTIRKLFATSISENAIHGSDSNKNVLIESRFHFSEEEMF